VSNLPAVLGLVAFTGAMALTPLYLQRRHMRLTHGVPMMASEKPLTDAQVRRGPYLNTGSKDAGADPDWDHKTNTHKGKRPSIADASR
jgi:hypothetical protein